MTLVKDYVCFFEIVKMGTGNLEYSSVERIFYLPPGRSMGDGLRQIRDDGDAHRIVDGARRGVGTLFLEATPKEGLVGDNETLSDGQEAYNDSDPENSAVAADVGIVHLIDDSDRTSDPEFHQAMEHLGVANRRRRVSQNQAGPDVVENDGGEPNDDLNGDLNDDIVIPEADHNGSDGDDELNQSDSEDPDYEAVVSSYRGSSVSAHECVDKIDGDEVSSIAAQHYYDPNCEHSKIDFQPGLKFRTPSQFKEAVANYSISVGAEIRWKRSNKLNKEAVCAVPGCTWRVFASWFGRNIAFIVKSVGDPHSCPRSMHNRCATAKWIARQYLKKFKTYPNIDPAELAEEIKNTHSLEVTTRVVANAKTIAKRILSGTLEEAYARLRSYLLQLKKSDPDGKFVVEVDPVEGEDYVLFKRMYIGFSCLRKGFLKGCRKLIGLDGCFLKGEVQGMLLSAVAKDGNNQMFPIAWAVVEGENRDSWTWFVELLAEELELDDGYGWSIISDQQKVFWSIQLLNLN
ncbi:hypothetical protein LINGRAHAP2_LOCUS25024 [Linum grandiflorum]